MVSSGQAVRILRMRSVQARGECSNTAASRFNCIVSVARGPEQINRAVWRFVRMPCIMLASFVREWVGLTEEGQEDDYTQSA